VTSKGGSLETAALTVLALFAFAANSILTRLALGERQIDAATFASVRLASGALVLAVLVRRRQGAWPLVRAGDLKGALALFAYAAPFSFAYLRIGAAVGALVLFGVVQLTMIGWGVARGERPGARVALGWALSATGLAVLTVPAATRPDPAGTALMVVAGVAWGIYSLRGKGAVDPIAANARSFLGAVPLALLLSALTAGHFVVSGRGVILAAVSGAVTSALGYAVWYQALRGLTATGAAIVQLSVPVIAAFAAVVMLGEAVSGRLAVAGAAVLGGVALALTASRGRPRPRPS
jgi:drug/metabolite transporter (DMT)-like permease